MIIDFPGKRPRIEDDFPGEPPDLDDIIGTSRTPAEDICPLCLGGEDCYPWNKELGPGERACLECEATMRGEIVLMQQKIDYLQRQLKEKLCWHGKVSCPRCVGF